jgi:hypothetical protein
MSGWMNIFYKFAKMKIEQEIQNFFDSEKNQYQNLQAIEDKEHLLPITNQRFREKFEGKLTEEEIEKHFETFECLV